jgi:hypothetical protein
MATEQSAKGGIYFENNQTAAGKERLHFHEVYGLPDFSYLTDDVMLGGI